VKDENKALLENMEILKGTNAHVDAEDAQNMVEVAKSDVEKAKYDLEVARLEIERLKKEL
jgi:uncharacterized protein (DUF3084 family)